MKKLLNDTLDLIDQVPINYSDRLLARFIAARTVRYDKISEVIPTRHFLEGVNGTRPCGLPERTLKRSQVRLAQAGLITIKHRKSETFGGDLANEYTLHLEAIKEAAMTSKLKVPRKPKKPHSSSLATVAGRGCQSGKPSEVVTYRSSKNKNQVTNVEDDARSLGEIVDSAKQKTVASRRRRAGKLTKGRSADALRAAWHQACLDHYPDAPVAPVSSHMAARFAQMTVNYLPTGDDIAGFVEWAVSNWEGIRAEFKWMNKPKVPLHPSLDWCARHCTRLFVARSEVEARAGQRMEDEEKAKLVLENHELKKRLSTASSGRDRLTQIREERDARLAKQRAAAPPKEPVRPPRPASEFGITFDDIPDLPAWEDRGK